MTDTGAGDQPSAQHLSHCQKRIIKRREDSEMLFYRCTMIRFVGVATFQTIRLVSSDPVTIRAESGDHAKHVTFSPGRQPG